MVVVEEEEEEITFIYGALKTSQKRRAVWQTNGSL